MSSLGSILGIGRGALLAQQQAMQVTSHNVANAETPGYTRQRATLTASYPLRLPQGTFGTGVSVTNVGRARDVLLDGTFRQQSGAAAGASLRQDVLGQVENVLNEPADGAIASTLDRFWDSWSDLANAPTSPAAKAMVVQRGGQLADAFRAVATGLTTIAADARGRLATDVDQVNSLAARIATLNKSIVSSEVGGQEAGDLRDQRDQAIDSLSKLGSTSVIERPNGSVGVYIGTATLVDGESTRPASVTTSGGRLGIAIGSQALNAGAGTLVEGLRVLNDVVPGTRAKIDTLAAGVIRGVNAAHLQGYSAISETEDPTRSKWTATPASASGSRVAFFSTDAGTQDAAGIALNAEVLRDPGFVATGYTRYANGDNALALDLAALRTAGGGIGTGSFADFHRGIVSGLAADVADAGSSADAADALVQQADARRQSVSGVSTDEELIALTKQQQAYAAAAKIIKTVDEMMQTLLSLKN